MLSVDSGLFVPAFWSCINGSLNTGILSFLVQFTYILWLKVSLLLNLRMPRIEDKFYVKAFSVRKIICRFWPNLGTLILTPLSEKFNKIPVWVRLPYLPLHLWADSLFEEIGDAIGNFIMVDNESFELYHTSFAHILVELDVSKGLPVEIVINSSFGS